MSLKNPSINFYITKSEDNSEYYSISNLYTDYPIYDHVTLDEVYTFLKQNDPSHPMLKYSSTQSNILSDLFGNPMVKEYTLDSFLNPYNSIEDFYSFNAPTSVSYLVNENDLCAQGPNLPESEEVDDAESYGDSNHLPYIYGKIKDSRD